MKISFKEVIKNSKKFRSPKGFTLVELLIVIAILGILATAVLSAINPIEQINRGRDTGTQSDAEQLVEAVQRYQAAQGYYPWQVPANSPSNSTLETGSTCTDGIGGAAGSCTHWTAVGVKNNPGTGTNQTNGWTMDNVNYVAYSGSAWAAGNNVLDVLSNAQTTSRQEILPAFVTRITAVGYNTLYVWNRGQTGDSTYVCFKPQSQQFLAAAEQRCGATTPVDFPVDACDSTTPANDYSCLP